MTETDFFRLIDNPGSTGLGTAYNEFTTTVVSLCKERESICRTVFALSYAETELQYHDAMQETDSSRSMYVRKALSFVRKMLKYYQVGLHRGGAFDGGEKTNQRQDEAAAMQWTGSTAELVELIYGLDEMKLINGCIKPPKNWALNMVAPRVWFLASKVAFSLPSALNSLMIS